MEEEFSDIDFESVIPIEYTVDNIQEPCIDNNSNINTGRVIKWKQCKIINERIEVLEELVTQIIKEEIEELLVKKHQELFIEVLELYSIECPTYMNLEIYSHYIVKSIRLWNKFNKLKIIFRKSDYSQLYRYLNRCLKHFRKFENTIMKKILSNWICNYDISVTCSFKQLQTMFNHDFPNSNFYRDETEIALLSHQLRVTFPQFISNWPFISTQINLPNFSMEHKNINQNEFHLINNCDGKQKRIAPIHESLKLYQQKLPCSSKTLESNLVRKFLEQLLMTINSKVNNGIFAKRKTELNRVINELIQDVNLCTDTIETNTNYVINTFPYPYKRFLNYPIDSEPKPKTKIENQKLKIDLKLRQTSQPKILFLLKEFDFKYQVNDYNTLFTIDAKFFSQLNDCISYRCTMCDEDLGGCSPSQKIFDHLSMFHGYEPCWYCTFCDKPFSTNYLSNRRWAHDCKGMLQL